METYKIKLFLKGEITEIPDSQKIFGWLTQQLADFHNEDAVNQFIQSTYQGESMVSNLLPEGYVPTPKVYLIKKLSEINKEKNFKEQYEILKKIDYIRMEQLEKLCKDNQYFQKQIEGAFENTDFLKKEKSYIQKFRINSQYYQIPGMKNEAYSIPVTRLRKNNFSNKKSYQKDFSILIKTKNKLLSKWLQDNEYSEEMIFLGARASQGMNSYQIKGIEKITDETTYKKQTNNIFLNLGMLLPSEKVDYKKSFLDIYTSVRKPYEFVDYKRNEIDETISFIDVGSIVYSESKVNEIGNCIRNPFNMRHNNAIVFGKSYLISLPLKGCDKFEK